MSSINWERITGYTMILLVVCGILAIAISFGMTDQEPTNRDDLEQFLLDVEDKKALAVLTAFFFVMLDAVVGLVLAGLLYFVFRDRSRPLALIVLVGLVANAAIAGTSDAIGASMIAVADGYVNGGVGLEAGDPAFLDIAYAMAWMSNLTVLVGFTALGIGLVALGWLLWAAPEGNVNPPRIYGAASVLAGLTAFLSWIAVATEIGFLFFALQGIFSIVLLVGVGAHLIMRSGEGSQTAAAS
ncbi:MAG TPA: hypothetical protein VIW01_12890 [Dehalococcoidia bacterium]